MATCTIDRAEPGDLVAMAQCMAIDADAFPYASAQFGARTASGRVWVARDDARGPRGPAGSGEAASRVIGFLAARVRRSAMHVEGLAVEERARRRGIARALVRVAVDHARAIGLGAVGLHVSVTNAAAVALYESEGFAIARTLRAFYPPTAFEERDAFQMVLKLSAPA
jgi:ribosomal protein S18 acetylase RimI-like enzyme